MRQPRGGEATVYCWERFNSSKAILTVRCQHTFLSRKICWIPTREAESRKKSFFSHPSKEALRTDHVLHCAKEAVRFHGKIEEIQFYGAVDDQEKNKKDLKCCRASLDKESERPQWCWILALHRQSCSLSYCCRSKMIQDPQEWRDQINALSSAAFHKDHVVFPFWFILTHTAREVLVSKPSFFLVTIDNGDQILVSIDKLSEMGSQKWPLCSFSDWAETWSALSTATLDWAL